MKKTVEANVKQEICLAHFLKQEFGLTEKQIRQAKFRENGILVNGERSRVNAVLQPGDRVCVMLEREGNTKILPADGALAILYEDEDLLILNKAAGVVVHPSHGHFQDSILNQAVGYLKGRGENGTLRVSGRLDKDTSGVLVIAKNQVCAARLAMQRQKGIFRKEYLAFLEREEDISGTVDRPIKKDPHSLMKMTVAGEYDGEALPAVTHYRKTGIPGLVHVTLEHGRTHQIRVHMASLGYPLLGDPLYGREDSVMKRAALHAWKVVLRQPFSGEKLEVTADLPEDFRKMISKRGMNMKAWEKNIRKVVPYTPGEQPNHPDMIKLNTNENPYSPAPGVEKALREMDMDALRLYPDPTAGELVRTVADYYHLKEEQVFVGVGSDDVLAMCFLTFFNSEKPILFPDITYSFYDVWAELFRIPYETPALDEEFRIVKDDYFRANGGVIFPNPNAPTGVELPLSEIEEIIRKNPDSIVIVDEAYVDFGAVSALPLIETYENLLVVQTMSKSRSLAGMRIGMVFGNPALIRYLNDVKYSFNSYTMNRTSIVAGIEAMKDSEYFHETRNKIIETREWAKSELKKLGFRFQDSKANFIFASHERVPAEEIFQALREQHIYVRFFRKPRIQNYLRITIGTREEMEKLILALKKLLG